MPPRKKKNNEELERIKQEKISSFVNTANERDNESSDEEYNIYVKSARDSKVLEEPSPPPETPQIKKKKFYKQKVVPDGTSREPSGTPLMTENDRMFKMFEEYKNELNELRSTIAGGTKSVVPTPPIDIRREMMKLKFG